MDSSIYVQKENILKLRNACSALLNSKASLISWLKRHVIVRRNGIVCMSVLYKLVQTASLLLKVVSQLLWGKYFTL
jgi:hypothetical protein